MKKSTLFIILGWMLIFSSCDPYEPEMIFGYKTSDTKDVYIQPEVFTVGVGDTNFLRIESQNGCAQLSVYLPDTANFKIVSSFYITEHSSVRYHGRTFSKEEDEWHYYGGKEQIYTIVGLIEGDIPLIIKDRSGGFADTVITLHIIPSSGGQDDNASEYTFTEDRSWPVTETQIQIQSKGPKKMYLKVMDQFIYGKSSSDANSSVNGVTTSTYWLIPKFTGRTYVKFYNEDFDTLIPIEFLPTYNTYDEPGLDFDDTKDSMIVKMGSPSDSVGYEHTYLYFMDGGRQGYTVTVRLNGDGLVDNYEIALQGSTDSEELKSFIVERYYKTSTQWHGHNVYLRAFDVSSPSVYNSNAYMAITEDFIHSKVTYRNPATFNSWQ